MYTPIYMRYMYKLRIAQYALCINLRKGEGCWGWMGETTTREENCANVNICWWWKFQCGSTSKPQCKQILHIFTVSVSCTWIVTHAWWYKSHELIEMNSSSRKLITMLLDAYYLFYYTESFLSVVLAGNSKNWNSKEKFMTLFKLNYHLHRPDHIHYDSTKSVFKQQNIS